MLARFERLVEQAVEGSLRRVLPTHLQPVQLAKAAARAMEEAQIIGVRGAEVPTATSCASRRQTWNALATTPARSRTS